MVVAVVIAGGGFFAWQKGFVDQAVEKGTEIAESMETQVEVVPAAEPETEVTTKPAAKSEPEPAPVKITNAKPFRDRLRSGGRGPVMIRIPGGKFLMGGRSGIVSPDEIPRHEVRIKPFAVSVYEVTFEDYYRFAKAAKRKKPKNNSWDIKTHPVVDVSWDDAQAYVRWLSKQTGQRYRLLSEAEWEYVARAGTTASFWWGTKAGVGRAHCFDCRSEYSISKPARVGTYRPNPFGLYDTAGNVYEWVHDCYHRNYNGAPDDGSVWEGGDCKVRVVRGGAYRSPATSMRVENREKFGSNKGQYNVGIRIARDL